MTKINMTKFEINSEFRLMESTDLVYILTNNERKISKVKEEELFYGESYDLDAVLESMTPSRKKLVMAGIELYKRCSSQKGQRTQIRCSTDIYDLMQPIMGDCLNEEAWVLYLNQSARVIRKQRVSSGGIASTVVDTRVILKGALMCDATSLILCHNHPSGNHRPSGEDDRLTKTLFEASKTMNIKMLDHLVICRDSYYSYADEGRL